MVIKHSLITTCKATAWNLRWSLLSPPFGEDKNDPFDEMEIRMCHQHRRWKHERRSWNICALPNAKCRVQRWWWWDTELLGETKGIESKSNATKSSQWWFLISIPAPKIEYIVKSKQLKWFGYKHNNQFGEGGWGKKNDNYAIWISSWAKMYFINRNPL